MCHLEIFFYNSSLSWTWVDSKEEGLIKSSSNFFNIYRWNHTLHFLSRLSPFPLFYLILKNINLWKIPHHPICCRTDSPFQIKLLRKILERFSVWLIFINSLVLVIPQSTLVLFHTNSWSPTDPNKWVKTNKIIDSEVVSDILEYLPRS